MDKRKVLIPLVAACFVFVAGAADATSPEPTSSDPTSSPIRGTACSVDSMVDNLRDALQSGTPALKRYASTLLREAALTLPADALRAAFMRERDPAVVEALGSALATKASHSEDPTLIQPLLSRARNDSDPAVRAAALRGLKATGSVEMMAKSGERVRYEQLIQDPSPEVRKAVVENLVAENAEVYGGHDRTVSETAVSVAKASTDPKASAALLEKVSMEKVGPRAVQQLGSQLESPHASVRAAAATALGGVPGQHAGSTRHTLTELYRSDSNPEIRNAILGSLARLGQAQALPAMESLRGVDPAMNSEIDAWTSALKLNLQEWNLILREKERLQR